MNRIQLQQLARLRLREANVLMLNGQYSGAYYLCGFTVECGLKACIARKTNRYDFADKEVVIKSHSHNLEQLIGIAGLKPNLETEIKNNITFATNWSTVKDWDVKSRYEIKTQIQAQNLYNAITGRTNGILKWLRQHW